MVAMSSSVIVPMVAMSSSVLILAKICAQFALNVPQTWKSFWPHTMDQLGDVDQMEAHFGPFGDSVNLDARLVHSLRRKWNRLRNHFGRTR
jgi:hypothetical protein